MSDGSDACDPCARLGVFVGSEVEKRSESLALGVAAATGATLLCVYGLAYLKNWARKRQSSL